MEVHGREIGPREKALRRAACARRPTQGRSREGPIALFGNDPGPEGHHVRGRLGGGPLQPRRG